jgi:hypothetical protein
MINFFIKKRIWPWPFRLLLWIVSLVAVYILRRPRKEIPVDWYVYFHWNGEKKAYVVEATEGYGQAKRLLKKWQAKCSNESAYMVHAEARCRHVELQYRSEISILPWSAVIKFK